MIGATVDPDAPRFAGKAITGLNDVPVGRSGIGCGKAEVAFNAPIDAAVMVPFVAGAPELVKVTVKEAPFASRVSTGLDALMMGATEPVVKNPIEL